MKTSPGEITTLLRDWNRGDTSALRELIPLVYPQLQAAARHYMAKEDSGHILQSTALINETYLQLVRLDRIHWQDRGHFFAVCARLMRRVLTDYARAQLSLKRGQRAQEQPLNENVVVPIRDARAELIALDDALQELAALDERMGRIVQLHIFGGFTMEEIAAAMGISERTVFREWIQAKLWLLRELDGNHRNAE